MQQTYSNQQMKKKCLKMPGIRSQNSHVRAIRVNRYAKQSRQ